MSSEGHVNVSDNFRRLPKISEKDQTMFRSNSNNFYFVETIIRLLKGGVYVIVLASSISSQVKKNF